MHFRHNDFARNEGLSTMLPLQADVPPDTLGSSNKGTVSDFDHIRILYCARKCMQGCTMHAKLRYMYIHVVLDTNECREHKIAKSIFYYNYSTYMKFNNEILVFFCILLHSWHSHVLLHSTGTSQRIIKHKARAWSLICKNPERIRMYSVVYVYTHVWM